MEMVIMDPEDFMEMGAIGWMLSVLLSVLAMLVMEMKTADLL